MMLGGISDAILLVALGLGYVVCYLAKREDKAFKSLGYLIGVFIITLSGILIVSNLILSARVCARMGGMGKVHRQMMQPGQPKVPPQK